MYKIFFLTREKITLHNRKHNKSVPQKRELPWQQKSCQKHIHSIWMRYIDKTRLTFDKDGSGSREGCRRAKRTFWFTGDDIIQSAGFQVSSDINTHYLAFKGVTSPSGTPLCTQARNWRWLATKSSPSVKDRSTPMFTGTTFIQSAGFKIGSDVNTHDITCFIKTCTYA